VSILRCMRSQDRTYLGVLVRKRSQTPNPTASVSADLAKLEWAVLARRLLT
jgi:hypothetical protein